MDSTSTSPALDENWTPERLQSLLDDQIQEDFRLEYKGLDALPLSKMKPEIREAKREEIGKDVTAFANSDGGVIIYGIKETRLSDGRPVPEKFQPVSMAEISREQLAQIIAANSEPVLAGVRILPVQAPEQSDHSQVCYIVAVPQSDTAHMAKDGRYYFRNETTTERMRDWQVRDAMNRKKLPDVKAEIEFGGQMFDFAKHGQRQKLQIRIANIGKVLARNFCAVVHFPTVIEGKHVWFDEDPGMVEHRFDNLPDGEAFHWLISNRQGDPLFPGRIFRRYYQFALNQHPQIIPGKPTRESIPDVRITLFADEMPLCSYIFPVITP